MNRNWRVAGALTPCGGADAVNDQLEARFDATFGQRQPMLSGRMAAGADARSARWKKARRVVAEQDGMSTTPEGSR